MKTRSRSLTPAQPQIPSITSRLAETGLRFRRIRGDGNCLFRAFSFLEKGIETDHAEYRKLAVDYIEQHPTEFENYIEKDDHNTIEEYLKEMRDEQTWGGFPEIVALSRVLSCEVFIWHMNGQPTTHVGDGNDWRKIHLVYNGETHYHAAFSPPPRATVCLNKNGTP